MKVVSDRIAGSCNRSGTTLAIALDMSKAIDRVWHAGLLYKLSFTEFQVRYFGLFLLFLIIRDGFGRVWMGSLHKNIQLIVDFLRAPFLVLRFSSHAWMTFLMMLFAVLLSMLMILLSTPKYDNVFDLWQQLGLAYKFESDLRDTMDRRRKWLVDFNARKTQLVSFDWSNNTGAIDVNMYGSFFMRKNIF